MSSAKRLNGDLFNPPVIEPTIHKSAVFSTCRQYRYTLHRIWDDTPPAMFICLNPSTADEREDDPTVRRCINYSKAWGYGGFIMTNLFGYRATDRDVMKAQQEPIGPDNDRYLLHTAKDAGVIVAAWGIDGEHMGRSAQVRELLADYELMCLTTTSSGEPGHPLYLKKTLKPVPLEG